MRITHDDLQRELGGVQAEMQNIRADIDEIKSDVKSMRDSISMGRGGLRVLISLSGLFVAILLTAAWVGQRLRPFA